MAIVKDAVFILYGGTSEDSRGSGKYKGKTTNPKEAKKYWNKIKKNPYSTGKVMAYTDSAEILIWDEKQWTLFIDK